MTRLLAVKFWLKMLSTFLDAIFPVTLALLVLAPFNKGGFKKGQALPLLATALCLGLLLRLLLFMFGLPSERRYLFSLAALAAAFAAPGIETLVRMVLKAKPSFKASWTALAIFATIFAVCAGKGLNPSFEKVWMKQAASFVKEKSAGAPKTYLIMDSEDMRIPYYAEADYVKFCRHTDENPVRKFEDTESFHPIIDGILARKGRRELSTQWIAIEGMNCGGISHFADNMKVLQRDGAKVFVLMEMSEADFKGLFESRQLPFPLRKALALKDEKKRSVILYEPVETASQGAEGQP